MIYLDTSAFLKLYIREKESETVQHMLAAQREPVPIADVLQLEFVNSLRLKVFWGELDAPTVTHLLSLFDDRVYRGQYHIATIERIRLLSDFRTLSLHTQSIGCRSLDILHVACALQLNVDTFITFDDRQRELASREGLRVT